MMMNTPIPNSFKKPEGLPYGKVGCSHPSALGSISSKLAETFFRSEGAFDCANKVIARLVVSLLVTLATQNLLLSQKIDVPRDTSYTVPRALEHIKNQNEFKGIDITPANSGSQEQIKSQKEFVYKTIGERELLANIFYPKKSKGKKPAVLIIHGGGWRSGDKSLMTPMAERLAANGYFVMASEYRLSLESQYPESVYDLYDALDWIIQNAKEYGIDTDNMVVMGCSAGAQLAALVGTTYNQPNNIYDRSVKGKIATIVVVDGVLAFKHPDSAEGKVAGWWLGGSWEEVPEIWTEASALTHVDQYTSPTIFLASIYPRFLAGRQDYVAKLDDFGTASETHFMEQAPHSFWLFNPWYEPTMDYVLKFLSNNLNQ